MVEGKFQWEVQCLLLIIEAVYHVCDPSNVLLRCCDARWLANVYNTAISCRLCSDITGISIGAINLVLSGEHVSHARNMHLY